MSRVCPAFAGPLCVVALLACAPDDEEFFKASAVPDGDGGSSRSSATTGIDPASTAAGGAPTGTTSGATSDGPSASDGDTATGGSGSGGEGSGGASTDGDTASGGNGGESSGGASADGDTASGGSGGGNAGSGGVSSNGAGGDGGSSGGVGGTGDGGSGAVTDSGSNGTGGSGSGGSGGSGEEVMDCTAEVTLTEPLVVDFESYDGISDPFDWSFFIAGAGSNVTGRVDEYQDDSGTYSVSFVAGAGDSAYAVSAQNPSASNWGGGVGLRLHCLDASLFTGLEFMIKGRTPAGTAEIGLGLNGVERAVVYQFEMPSEWELLRVEFEDFEGGLETPNAATDGTQITSLHFSSQLSYVQRGPGMWVPEPGEFEVTVDSVAFY